MSSTDATPPPPANPTGTLAWLDLTIADAPGIRDFYSSVIGWQPEPVAMGEYDDYSMKAPEGTIVAGVCHARGENADLPPQWLVYVMVDDLDASLQRCAAGGGTQISTVRGAGPGSFCVIRDPAGAVLALMQRPE